MGATSLEYPNKRRIFNELVAFLNQGKLYDLDDPHPRIKGVFAGSADRYTEIAFGLQGKRKVLDVGSGSGMLISVLANLGHECCGLDLTDPDKLPSTYRRPSIEYKVCNVEVDTYPFPDATFDAVTCCQVLEHFSHSPLPALAEMKRVLKPGGVIELDVPNVACFRNRMRMLRGKNITWDYRNHYLLAKPLFHKGYTFYPFRHNREFTKAELAELLAESGFVDIQVRFMRDKNYRTGFQKLRSLGTAARNLIPSIRKSLIGFAKKG